MEDPATGTPSAPPLVSAIGICKAYGGAQALRGAALTILPGEAHGLVGANGAGKSTLIRILAGLTAPDAGEILIDGKPVAIENSARREHARDELHSSGARLRSRNDSD